MKRTFLQLLVLAAAAVIPLRAEPVDLLIVATDDAALQPIIEKMAQPQVETRGAWTFWSGTLSGKSVVLTRSE